MNGERDTDELLRGMLRWSAEAWPQIKATMVRPMELQVVDRFVDANAEWEVISRPYSAAGGKGTHAHVRKVRQPAMAEIRTWDAHERIAVKRAWSPPLPS